MTSQHRLSLLFFVRQQLEQRTDARPDWSRHGDGRTTDPGSQKPNSSDSSTETTSSRVSARRREERLQVHIDQHSSPKVGQFFERQVSATTPLDPTSEREHRISSRLDHHHSFVRLPSFVRRIDCRFVSVKSPEADLSWQKGAKRQMANLERFKEEMLLVDRSHLSKEQVDLVSERLKNIRLEQDLSDVHLELIKESIKSIQFDQQPNEQQRSILKEIVELARESRLTRQDKQIDLVQRTIKSMNSTDLFNDDRLNIIKASIQLDFDNKQIDGSMLVFVLAKKTVEAVSILHQWVEQVVKSVDSMNDRCLTILID